MHILQSPCRKRCTKVRHGEMRFKETLLFSPPDRSIVGPGQVGLCGCWYSCKHGVSAGSGQHLPFLCSTSTLEIVPYAFLELQGSAFTTDNLIYSWRSCKAGRSLQTAELASSGPAWQIQRYPGHGRPGWSYLSSAVQALQFSNQFPSTSHHFPTILEDILILQILVLASDLHGQISELHIIFIT